MWGISTHLADLLSSSVECPTADLIPAAEVLHKEEPVMELRTQLVKQLNVTEQSVIWLSEDEVIYYI